MENAQNQDQKQDDENINSDAEFGSNTSNVDAFDSIQRRARDLLNNYEQIPQMIDRAVHDHPYWSVGAAFALGFTVRAVARYAPEGSLQKVASYGGRTIVPALANAMLRR